MRVILRSLIMLSLLSAPCLRAGGGGGDDAESLVSKIQKKYDSAKNATITFTESIQFGATKIEQNFRGTLVVRKGNKYRVEMERQTVVTDGKSIWSFNKTTNQLFVDRYEEDPRTISPDKVLVSLPDRYTPAILGKEILGKKETTIVKLLPREEDSHIRGIKVWVDTDQWIMRKVQVVDASDNQYTYTADETTFDTGVPDSLFSFSPPPGASVIDLR